MSETPGSRVQHAQVIQVIEIRGLRGTGTEGDPYRHIVEYWSLDGAPLAQQPDTYTPTPEQ